MTLVWLSDLRLNATLTGPQDAPPLVLLHGLGLDLRVWDALLPHLARHRVLRLDLRGHGASDSPPPPYTLGSLIRDTERLIDHFALKDTVVLGAGEGGLIAQGLAVKRLDLVRAMVLTGSATRFGNPALWQDRIATRRAKGPDHTADLARLIGPRWAECPQSAKTRTLLQTTTPAGWEGFATAIATADLYQTTATLKLPTLILAGADDRAVPPDMQRDLAELVAGAEVQLLPNAGHLAMLTHPDTFGKAILAFLTRIGHV